jgi:hypothetical protein
MRRWPGSLLVFVTVVVAGGLCKAQSNNPVTITINYTRIHDRLGPDPRTGIHVRISATVTLSGKNTINERWDRQASRYSRQSMGTSNLGSGSWRVASPNTLIRTQDEPHSRTTITVRVSGDSCEAQVSASLKPGFTDFMFSRLDTGDMAPFSAPQFSDVSCSIR